MRPYITRSEEIMLLIEEYERQNSNELHTAAIRTYYEIEDNITLMRHEIASLYLNR